ncbi:hypothetical protein MERGE_000679 [Pneumocystis wakefieldiae]|uniref:DNA-directed RNA polymerase I, II, and III subunit RPABC4 n=1 Tax=Pneumocystis wakefieldiae TaxID=38082 RepID=A0A899FWX4_9ASCO|nr:hypothetical protein MERGE_000679 [Pneumocystis wakefieldiae]
MQRDTYKPSVLTDQPIGTAQFAARSVQMSYLCADCGAINQIQAREVIRCRECGHRVMYKQRTKRMIQFEAR